jgi:hypothetical protein
MHVVVYLSKATSYTCIEIQKNDQWVETNPSNICIFATDIHFSAALWNYAKGINTDVNMDV